jgi:hypothetical protein
MGGGIAESRGGRSESSTDSLRLENNPRIQGIAYVRLNNLRAAQTAYEAALASGFQRDEELVKLFRLLFQLAATNQQAAKAVEFGEKAYGAGALNSNDLLIMS